VRRTEELKKLGAKTKKNLPDDLRLIDESTAMLDRDNTAEED
jgi:hypothetical protein